jgi:hypothetical protein
VGYVRLILKDIQNEKIRQAARMKVDPRGGVILYRADGTVKERIPVGRVGHMSIKCISEDEVYIDYIHHCPGALYKGIRAWQGSCQFLANESGESFSKLNPSGPVYQYPVSDPGRWDRVGAERVTLAPDHADLEQLLTGKITFEAALRIRP